MVKTSVHRFGILLGKVSDLEPDVPVLLGTEDSGGLETELPVFTGPSVGVSVVPPFNPHGALVGNLVRKLGAPGALVICICCCNERRLISQPRSVLIECVQQKKKNE